MLNLDAQKIHNKIEELNRTQGGSWQEVGGLFAITVVEPKEDSIAFNPASGLILKPFFNQATGEVKIFPAKIFE